MIYLHPIQYLRNIVKRQISITNPAPIIARLFLIHQKQLESLRKKNG